MYASVEAFFQELEALKHELFPDANLEILYSRFNKLSIRIVINASFFIDIYCNAEKGRFDFALIQSAKRIFGYDNLAQWHRHPAHNPALHVSCDEPTLRQVLGEMAATIQSIKNEA